MWDFTYLCWNLTICSLTRCCLSQENCVYRITASECLHEPKERSLTGFIVNATRGIYTALHGVVDATRIGALGQQPDQAFSALQISKVDIQHDVALLDSPELNGKNLPGLDLLEFSQPVDPGPLTVIGHPYGIDLIRTSDLLLRKPGLVELRTLLESDAEIAAEDRGSPYYMAMMLSIQGKFLPGDSGAPVLDSNNRVIAIVDGGLRAGLADISWPVPIPEKTVVPSACRISEPAPNAMTNGQTPMVNANEVIRIGRNRNREALTACLSICRNWQNAYIISLSK